MLLRLSSNATVYGVLLLCVECWAETIPWGAASHLGPKLSPNPVSLPLIGLNPAGNANIFLSYPRFSLIMYPNFLFQKFGSNQSKPEFTVDLRGASVEWASKEKSSKKHVIEVSVAGPARFHFLVCVWNPALTCDGFPLSAEDPSGHGAADPVRDRQRHQRLVPGPHRDRQHSCECYSYLNLGFSRSEHRLKWKLMSPVGQAWESDEAIEEDMPESPGAEKQDKEKDHRDSKKIRGESNWKAQQGRTEVDLSMFVFTPTVQSPQNIHSVHHVVLSYSMCGLQQHRKQRSWQRGATIASSQVPRKK